MRLSDDGAAPHEPGHPAEAHPHAHVATQPHAHVATQPQAHPAGSAQRQPPPPPQPPQPPGQGSGRGPAAAAVADVAELVNLDGFRVDQPDPLLSFMHSELRRLTLGLAPVIK
jgi:hypothetical protein